MTTLKQYILDYVADNSGATAIEYALIAALIALGMIGGASTLGGAVEDSYINVANEFP